MSTALDRAQAPIMDILAAPETEDLAFQEPGVGWWLHHGAWHRVEVPAMTYARMHGIAVMAAAQTRQEITHRNPILDCDLPGDLRLLAVMPPAVRPGTMVLSYRRGDSVIDELSDIPKLFGASRWNKWDGQLARQQERDSRLLTLFDAGELEGWLRGVAETRQTGLFAAPTGAGKTRLMKALVGAVPMRERIVTVEDAGELILRQPNFVRLFYATTGTGVTQAALLKATLRMRPDRIMLAEMRDREAALLFLSEIMAGHPGSLSTLHGRNAKEGARRLFNMLTEGLANTDDIAEQLRGAIDFIIPVENDGGVRNIGEIWFRPDAERRGESFLNLIKG